MNSEAHATTMPKAIAYALRAVLFNNTWNCRSQSSNITRVLLALHKGDFRERVEKDWGTDAEYDKCMSGHTRIHARDYMKGFYADFQKLAKLTPVNSTDSNSLFHIAFSIVMEEPASDLCKHNLRFAVAANFVQELLPHFNTDFRGKLHEVHVVPTSSDPIRIVETKKDGEDQFYVLGKVTYQYRSVEEAMFSEMFGPFAEAAKALLDAANKTTERDILRPDDLVKEGE